MNDFGTTRALATIQQRLNRLWRAWEQFFFKVPSYTALGIFRFAVGLNGLIAYSIRLSDWKFFFTDDGPVAASWASEILGEFYHPILTWYPLTAQSTLLLHIVFLLALFCLCIGIGGAGVDLAICIC